jgi:hypothetical protein
MSSSDEEEDEVVAPRPSPALDRSDSEAEDTPRVYYSEEDSSDDERRTPPPPRQKHWYEKYVPPTTGCHCREQNDMTGAKHKDKDRRRKTKGKRC